MSTETGANRVVKDDNSGYTPKQRHFIIISTLAELGKGTQAFQLRWREGSGEYLTDDILLKTPMFCFVRYKWTREEIETLFFKARVVIDAKFDAALQQTFGGEPGPRWIEEDEDADESSSAFCKKLCKKVIAILCCKIFWDSVALQIKKTPFKSTMIQLEGYEISRKSRKWIGSVCLALLLLVTAVVGSVVSVSSFNTQAICQGSSEQVAALLEEYKNMTGFYRNVGVGNASKAKVDELYYKAWDRYNYHKNWTNTSKTGSDNASTVFNLYEKYPHKDYAEQCRQNSSYCIDPTSGRNGRYNCSGANLTTLTGDCSWTGFQQISTGDAFPDFHPIPPGELEERRNQQCTVPVEIEVCWDGWGLKIICKKGYKNVVHDCGQDIDTKNLFIEGDVNADTNQSTVDYDELQYQHASEAAAEIMFVIYEQANVIASFYCCYLALLIFIGGPYALTSTRMKTKVQRSLSGVTKVYFVLIILCLYYGAQILDAVWTKFFIDTNLWLLMKMALANPCFADTTFLLELTAGAKEICTALGESEMLYNAVQNNLVRYEIAEQTYRFYYWQFANDTNPGGDDIRTTYNDETEFIFYDPPNLLNRTEGIYWDYNTTRCDTNLFLEQVGPSESEADMTSISLFITAIAALMMQPIIANLIWSIFVLIDPMAPYWGRIEMPVMIDKDNPVETFELEQIAVETSRKGTDVSDTNGTSRKGTGMSDAVDLEVGTLTETAADPNERKQTTSEEDQKASLEAIRGHVMKWERTKGLCPCLMWLAILIVIIKLQW